MANYLKVSMQELIRDLNGKGWSKRRIARELEIDRRTVSRYLAVVDSKCTISTTGSSAQKPGDSFSKCTISTTGSGGRQSRCEPWSDYIQNKLSAQLSAQRIYQDLVLEHGFDGSYESVKRYVKKLDDAGELPFRRIESAPGMEVQVDYGTGARIYDKNGKFRKTHLFRIVLSCSRKGYSEACYAQDTESFIRALENAFRSFGGVPECIVPDNLKAAVLKPDLYDPELNPKLRDFARHYGTCIMPCKVATPEHKGKVENSVNYVQENALKGRKFSSLQEQNDFLRNWERNVADKRIHGTTKRQVARMFEEEKPFLKPLPTSIFEVFTEVRRKVHRDGHVEVKGSYYSVPAEYVRREIWVRYTNSMIRIYNHRMQEIALHVRVEAGRFSTQQSHIPYEKISNPERGNSYMLKQADRIGGNAGAWARAMLGNRGIPGVRVLNGLLQLADKYTASAIEKGCKSALEMNAFRLHELKEYINDSYQAEQLKFEFLTDHPLIRQMDEYDNITQTKDVFYARTTSPESERPAAVGDDLLSGCTLAGGSRQSA